MKRRATMANKGTHDGPDGLVEEEKFKSYSLMCDSCQYMLEIVDTREYENVLTMSGGKPCPSCGELVDMGELIDQHYETLGNGCRNCD